MTHPEQTVDPITGLSLHPFVDDRVVVGPWPDESLRGMGYCLICREPAFHTRHAVGYVGAATQEPLIHSHITDDLAGDHPLAYENVDCSRCNAMVHAFNNECMQTWVETGRGAYCLACWFAELQSRGEDGLAVLDEEWAVRRPGLANNTGSDQ